MKVGVVDGELVGGAKHRFPNLAAMKISGYHKKLGDSVELVSDWAKIFSFDKVYISKVFTATQVPDIFLEMKNVVYGGTGFYFDKAPKLPFDIEHCFPDYSLYNEWVKSRISSGDKAKEYFYFTDCSIGFLTRGCFNKCWWCVNRNSSSVEKWSPVDEFLDVNRRVVILLDDQFFGLKEWGSELDNLGKTGKAVQFRQGLDLRLMTEEKIKKLLELKYYSDYVFAFDKIEDERIIRNRLEMWRKHTDKRTKLFLLCGCSKTGEYDDYFWVSDIINLFKRVFILAEYKCAAYVMRHEDYRKSPFRSIYSEIASWVNQPWALRTMSFRQYCIGRGMSDLYKSYRHNPAKYLKDGHVKGSQWINMEEFERRFPKVAGRFFDLQYSDGGIVLR